jgi:hypothetical protein
MSRLLVAQRALTAPRWTQRRLWRLARAVPSLDLNFADTKSLSDVVTGQSLVTFTRASSGTYVDSTGTLQTASTDVPRFDHNPTTGESLGLLVEEARTNLLLNSATLSTQNVTVTAVAHTLSFTGTGTITLSGTSTAGPLVGTGTGEGNRVSLTFTPTAGTLTLTVSGTVSNAQLELGSFRTSYIPTTTAAVTRSADVASITGTNFSSWYNQSEGTVFASAARAAIPTSTVWFCTASDGTINNRMQFGYGDSGGNYAILVSGSITGQAYPSVSSLTRNGAFAYGATGAVSYNGASSIQFTASSLPTVNQLSLDSFVGGGSGYLNGTFRRLSFFPQRLPNTTLQALTQ